MKNGRIILPMKTGTVLVGSDAHYWPGKPSTAHRAFVCFATDADVVIMNGDVIDASTISRHPPIGWEDHPSVRDELDVAQERLANIVDASPDARHIWTLGNHDARFETKLASVAPEFKHVFGVHLKDHFEEWEPAWGVEVGGKNGVMVKHRFKGGIHAAYGNVVASGRSTLTGHLHRCIIRPYTDYSGLRWGVEGGMLAEVDGPQFTGYTESNPLDWQSGFIRLTFVKGRMLMPEAAIVSRPGYIFWRGREMKV